MQETPFSWKRRHYTFLQKISLHYVLCIWQYFCRPLWYEKDVRDLSARLEYVNSNT